MKAIVIKLICPLLLLMILGCSEDFMAAKVKDHSTAATELSTTTDAAGNFSAALDPSSKSTQTMRATSGAVSGSAIAMPSGSLSIAVNVTIGEGATLASASTNKQIGLADNPATAAGPAVSFVPSSSVQASSPFTLAIPITASGSLALADSSIQSENLIVIYNWMNVVNGVATYSVGLLTRQDLTIGTKSVQFQTTKFGTYQLAVTQTKVIQKVEIPTAEPPVLKSEQPAVPVLLPPASLSYSVPSSRYTPGVAIAANMPSLSGGTPTSFSVLPALPAGLALHAVTGIISGTPVVQEASKTYTITALNTSGSATAQIVVAVIAASVPAVVLTSSAGTSTATSPIPIVATFSESVTDFALSDIVVTNGTAEGFSGSGTSYTFIVVPVEGVSMTVNIAAGVANGSDGSVNTAAAQLVRIYDITAPTGFALQSPSSGATVTTTPTLTWNASTDASSLTYTLYYNSGGGACTSGTSIPNLTSLSYTLSGLSSGTSYNWCVVATDVLGNSTSSGSFAFTSQAPAFTCDTGSFTAACVLTSGRSILDGTSVNIDGDLTISPGGSLYVSNAPYSTVLNVAGHLHLSGGYLLGNFIINAGSLTIDSGTAINATLLGAAGGVSNGDGAGSGPGSTTGGGYGYPSSGGGGGCHAGYCGANSTGGGWQSTTFGDGIFSVALYRGAGGGAGFSAAGGAGGGTISITVTGATTINGSISADGESGSAGGLYGGGGGAGGSIKIVTGTIAGTGSVTANGGAGGIGTSISGGGGSGGRIRIESFNKFSGEISASGGINSNIPHARGGDGTYTQNISGGYCDTYASPLCTISTKTWAGTDEIISFSQNLTLSGSGNLAAATKNQITSLTIQPKGFSVNVAGDLIVDASAIWAPAGAVPLQALDILTSLKAQTIQIDGSLVGNFPLIFAKNITVSGTGSITANGFGGAGGNGTLGVGTPGKGNAAGTSSANGSGGGNCGSGGYGNHDSSALADSYISSSYGYGSGGYGNIGVVGGAGGGKIKIVARNNLILSSSAVISADGYDSTTSSTSKGGGGAGGSILLDVGEILSNGSGISASGGKGSQVSGPTYYGGGGGGGCVRAFGKNTSAFTFGVSGGSGTSPGGAGSVFHSDLLTTGEFRKVFVTSGFYGLKAGRASLDTACSTEAASAGLYSSVSGVSWKALVSESASHATTLLSTHKVNNVRGEQVSYISSFFSSLVNPIQYYASGELAAAGSDVITGSNTTGAYDSTGSCVNYSASGIFNYSNPSSISSSWFSLNSTSGSGCDGTARVYCISQ